MEKGKFSDTDTLLISPIQGKQGKTNFLLGHSISNAGNERILAHVLNPTYTQIHVGKESKIFSVEVIQVTEKTLGKVENWGADGPNLTEEDFDLAHLGAEEREKVWDLILKYSDIFAKDTQKNSWDEFIGGRDTSLR